MNLALLQSNNMLGNIIHLPLQQFPPQRHPEAQSQRQISGSTSTEPVQVVLVLHLRLVLAAFVERTLQYQDQR